MNNEQQTFEQYLNTAKEILEKLSSSDITLTDSVALYKQGLLALENASKELESAKLIVQEAVSQ